MDRRKGFDLYHTEIVIIRKEVCPTSKFENIDQVTFKTNIPLTLFILGCTFNTDLISRHNIYFIS